MKQILFASWAMAAGALIPVMGVLNAGLGRATGSPAVAASVLFLVGFVLCLVVAALSGARGVGDLAAASPVQYLGGAIVAFYVLSITGLAPRIGIGNAIFFAVSAQLVTASHVDHFALFGVTQRPFTLQRGLGLGLLLLGLIVTQMTKSPGSITNS